MKNFKLTFQLIALACIIFIPLCVIIYRTSYSRPAAQETKYSSLESELRADANRELATANSSDRAAIDAAVASFHSKHAEADHYEQLANRALAERVAGASRIFALIAFLALILFACLSSLFILSRSSPVPSPSPA